MKLIIDIPNFAFITDIKVFRESVKEYSGGSGFDKAIREALLNGIPLPDGAEILTKEAYSDLCLRASKAVTDAVDRVTIKEYLESFEVAQPKMGHWEWVQYDSNPNIGNWHCSECRTIIPHMPEETDNTPIYKWCPMCGCKMREVKK